MLTTLIVVGALLGFVAFGTYAKILRDADMRDY